jgi:hypothetical protein
MVSPCREQRHHHDLVAGFLFMLFEQPGQLLRGARREQSRLIDHPAGQFRKF